MNYKTLITLLFFNLCFSQSYNYNEIYLRDINGNFIKKDNAGKFEITETNVYLFDQELEIKSKHVMFDERWIKIGFMYSLSDNVFWYTMLITNDFTLFFKDKDREMFRLKLIANNK